MGDYTMTINKSDTFESEEEMKAQIKLHHDNSLKNTPNAHADHSALSDTQVNGIQLNLKQLKGPNRSYYEFLDPTNGKFFMVYNKSNNIFSEHDFSKPIANPMVRKMAETKSEYLRKLRKM